MSEDLPNSLRQARKMMAGLTLPHRSRYPEDITEAKVAMVTAWALLDIAESLRALAERQDSQRPDLIRGGINP